MKQSVKRSLQELYKAINGDSKVEPQALFTVNILLSENTSGHADVCYSPDLVSLTKTVTVVTKQIVVVATAVPRIRAQQYDVASLMSASNSEEKESGPGEGLAPTATATTVKEDEKNKPYYEIICMDQDILRLTDQILQGMSTTSTHITTHKAYWDKYKFLWEAEKENVLKKYAKASNSPAQFDAEIQRYKQQQAAITGESSTTVISFVRIDCNAMKDALVGQCLQMQSKLTSMLNQNGVQELQQIDAFSVEAARS